MAQFITGERLSEEVYDIIYNASRKLLIVSPYIKLDNYFKKEVFNRHKLNPELHLIIVFGKNEKDPKKSFNNEDFEYFKTFPNITIVYVPNLHAKYYANENKGVVTSINLYDYSFKNNIEYGVISQTKLLGGSNIDIDAWDETMKILKENFAVFIRRPKFKKKILFGKDYLSSKTDLDLIDKLLNGEKLDKLSAFDFETESYFNEENKTERKSREEYERNNSSSKDLIKKVAIKDEKKLLSATALGKTKNKSYSEVLAIMKKMEFILDDKITDKGSSIGITYKSNKKGDRWIVYPESLKDLL